MKRLLSCLALVLAAATLSGCYYDPGYSYVRGSGYGGDAYYGDGGGTTYVAPAYDGYYGNGYGGYYGCCYAPGVSVGISSGWYGGSRYRRDDYRGRRDYDNHAGQWQGRSDRDYRESSRDDADSDAHGGDNQGQRRSNQGSRDSDGAERWGNRGHHRDGDDRH